MSEADLYVHILSLLLDAKQEMRPKDIEKELGGTIEARSKFSKSRESFHVKVHRYLDCLRRDGLIDCRKISHKDKRYFIKDMEQTQLIVAASAIGWTLKPSTLKMSTEFRAKNYDEIIRALSRFLVSLILQKKEFTQRAHTHLPGPIIVGFPIPIGEEKGNIIREKILIIMPDELSSTRIRTFTKEQYEDFVQYLTSAWSLYFEELHIAHGNIVIAHFTEEQAERLKQLVEHGEGKSVDDVVHLATLKHLDMHDPSKPYFKIEADGPATRIAIEKGIYRDKREAIIHAIDRHEKWLARKLLQTIG